MAREQGIRSDRVRHVVDVGSGDWGFGKAGTSLAPGALAAPNNVVLDDRGWAHNSGAGAPTGREIEADYSDEETEIAAGEWLYWDEKHGKVYVSRRNCAAGA